MVGRIGGLILFLDLMLAPIEPMAYHYSLPIITFDDIIVAPPNTTFFWTTYISLSVTQIDSLIFASLFDRIH